MSDFGTLGEWRFDVTVWAPDGVSIECTVTVPASQADDDIGEYTEVAQSGAWRAMSQHRSIVNYKREDAEAEAREVIGRQTQPPPF